MREPLAVMPRLAALLPPAAMNWAKRSKRVFGIEIDTCRRCDGTLRIGASIEQQQRAGGSQTRGIMIGVGWYE